MKKTRSPTSLSSPVTSAKTMQRRCNETFQAAERIHGATFNNKRPALDGLFETLQKKCKTEYLGNYVLSNSNVTKYVINNFQKNEKKEFETSNLNTLRSVAVYYDAGVMGKRKYQAVRLASSMMPATNRKRGGKTAIKYMHNCTIPKLLTYNKLVEAINTIDIGKVYSVHERFSSSIEDESTSSGYFRDLREYLPRLASFYLMTEGKKDKLKWFGETEGSFKVAFGGDGCPFGKNESACSFLISFLNTGKRVASSSDNFLVFGANCDENSLLVKSYVADVCKQISDIEGKVYVLDEFHVSFHFEELPNDMKMLAMLGGELPNSATYFSSFGNVTYADCGDLNGSFGNATSDKWKPWCYEQRVQVVQKVNTFKVSLKQSLADSTKRSKTTEFIAKQHSRQEFVPIIGKLIDKAHVEPLHLKNNAWQYFVKAVIKESMAKSTLQHCKKFEDIPKDACFSRVVTVLADEVKVNRVAKKLVSWYDETQGKKGDLQYRFTGKDSRLLCHNFMRLIKYLRCENDTQKQKQTVLALAYIGRRLRDCCSIFNRIDIDSTQLDKLKKDASEYFCANKLFLPYPINPTIWTLGKVLPVHAKDVYDKYKQGLLTVTMEGREAKHIALHRLSLNSSYSRRWLDIFRHEFIMLIWLQEQGHDAIRYTESKDIYIPQRVFNDNQYCYCGLEKANPEDESCCFCSDRLMTLIHESVINRKYMPGLSM